MLHALPAHAGSKVLSPGRNKLYKPDVLRAADRAVRALNFLEDTMLQPPRPVPTNGTYQVHRPAGYEASHFQGSIWVRRDSARNDVVCPCQAPSDAALAWPTGVGVVCAPASFPSHLTMTRLPLARSSVALLQGDPCIQANTPCWVDQREWPCPKSVAGPPPAYCRAKPRTGPERCRPRRCRLRRLS